MDSTTSQIRATMRHHEKMARLLRQVGKVSDAESADGAAERLREQLQQRGD